MLQVPLTTHGFKKTDRLPNGDLFLLPQPLKLTVVSSTDDPKVFTVDRNTFGGDAAAIGGFAGTTVQGLMVSTPNSTTRAISCLDDFWDIGFEVASWDREDGDRVRLFLQKPDGSGVVEVVTLEVKGGRLEVTHLSPFALLSLDDIFIADPDKLLHVGSRISFAHNAGIKGKRTGLLTLAFSTAADSLLKGCLQLGVEIKRGDTEDMTSIVFTSIQVKRKEVSGDRDRGGRGLLGGLDGGFPTGLICDLVCPPCPGQECPQVSFKAPALTHGLLTVRDLPKGDLFLLPQPLRLTLVSSSVEGATVFPVNRRTFGSLVDLNAGFLGKAVEEVAEGLAFSTPNATLKALSCLDQFQALVFQVASKGDTEGDRIRLFLQEADGSRKTTLVVLKVKDGELVLSEIHSAARFFFDNRFATGPSFRVGWSVPFDTWAGSSGWRTKLLTVVLSTSWHSSLKGCFQLGVEITRDDWRGTISLVFTEAVVKRHEQRGDDDRREQGLIGCLPGGFPTGLPCEVVCPACPD
jgi:hypothetical protein